MKTFDTWKSIDQAFIVGSLKTHLGISRACVKKLLDYARGNPMEDEVVDGVRYINYRIRGLDLDRDFLFIDANHGLRSKWIPQGRTFESAMNETADLSLANLYTFLSSIKEDGLVESLPSSSYADQQEWDRRYISKYGKP